MNLPLSTTRRSKGILFVWFISKSSIDLSNSSFRLEVLQCLGPFRGSISYTRLKNSNGAFPFEFLRRVYEIEPRKGPKHWSTSNLKEEFERSIEDFDINQTNRIPLLRRVVESGKFVEGHNYFCQENVENYFCYVGTKIAEKIIENQKGINNWVE